MPNGAAREMTDLDGREITVEKIDNPFLDFSKSELDRRIERWCSQDKKNRLDPYIPLFKKAARLIQDPESFKAPSLGLTKPEIDIIENETKHGVLHQSRPFRITIVTLCLAAVVQGWNQTGINGANLFWAKDLHIYPQRKDLPHHTRDLWTYCWVNAITYFSAAIFGSWLSDPLTEILFGRRAAIILSGACCLSSVIWGALASNWKPLLWSRFLLGLGMGAKASITPIFAAEVSPSHIRGTLLMNWQLYDTIGIAAGYLANTVVVYSGASWRWQIFSSAFPTLCLLTLIWACPESPRYYLMRGRFFEAFQSLIDLRSDPLLAARDLVLIVEQLEAEKRVLKGYPTRLNDLESPSDTSEPLSDDSESLRSSTESRIGPEEEEITNHCRIPEPFLERTSSIYHEFRPLRPEINPASGWKVIGTLFTGYYSRFLDLFRVPRIRRAVLASFAAMISQQLCGINVLMFYGSTFFKDIMSQDKPAPSGSLSEPLSRDKTTNSLWLNFGLGLANFIFAFPAYWWIEKKGRRFLMLASAPWMGLSMLLLSQSLRITDHLTRSVFVVTFVFTFVFFYSWGAGPCAFTYSAEVFPLYTREVGMSFAVFCNMFAAGLLALLEPIIENTTMSKSTTLLIFAGLNVVNFALIFLLMPETAGQAFRSSSDGLYAECSDDEESGAGEEHSSVNTEAEAPSTGREKQPGVFFRLFRRKPAQLKESAFNRTYLSLEEMTSIFNVSTRKHIRYQIYIIVPWAIRYYPLRVLDLLPLIRTPWKKPKRPSPLYVWEHVRSKKQRQREAVRCARLRRAQEQQQQQQQQKEVEIGHMEEQGEAARRRPE